MRGSAEFGEEDDFISVGRTKSRKTRKKKRRLEGCVAAGRNPLNGLLWPIKRREEREEREKLLHYQHTSRYLQN